MPMFGSKQSPTIEELLAQMQQRSPYQMGPDGPRNPGPPATADQVMQQQPYQLPPGSGDPMQGQTPVGQNPSQPLPNPQYTPEQIEQMRRGIRPFSPVTANPFARPY